jgi:hypothetical protein
MVGWTGWKGFLVESFELVVLGFFIRFKCSKVTF